MTWYDDEIAGPMGYQYCVLFDCARDAIAAYREVKEFVISLPENICPRVAAAAGGGIGPILEPINQQTGLAHLPVHLYGYQAKHSSHARISLDPLMTGWIRHLKTPSAIISFGRKKIIPVSYGGAFLTNDRALAEQMAERGHWNDYYTVSMKAELTILEDTIAKRFAVIDLWDRYLGDSLIRIPGEQLMPWRVMRRCRGLTERESLVYELREAGIDVGTNYPPLGDCPNEWGDTVLNFFCSPDIEKAEIQRACEIIKRGIYG